MGSLLPHPDSRGQDQGDGAQPLSLAADKADWADDEVPPGARVAGLHTGTEPHLHLGPLPARLLPVTAVELELDAMLGGHQLPAGLGQGHLVLWEDELNVWRGLNTD